MPEDKKVSDLYKDAIKQLEALNADPETDDAVRNESNKKILGLRTKVQGTALDNITSRSANLQTFMNDLQAVIAKAGHADVAGQVASFHGLVTQAKGMLDMMKEK